jgi:DNA-binding MarR family transcriptional regulator
MLNQLYYLESVYSLDRPTLSDLAKHLGISNASASIGIHKLMVKGLVNRVQSGQDKRYFYLHLSPEGENLMEAEKQAYSGFSAKIKSTLTKSEIESLVKIFQKIMDSYQKEEAMANEER